MNCKILNKKITPFMNFGKMPLANGFLKKEEFKNDPKCLLVIKKNEKFSRNEKCPATGKKYKHCCGAL